MKCATLLLCAGLIAGLPSPGMANPLSGDMEKGGTALGVSEDSAPDTPADPLAAYQAKVDEANAIADKMPLTAQKVVLEDRSAAAYGDYDPRASDVYKPSEKVFSYVELVGIVFKDVDGLQSYGFTVALTLLSEDGTSLFHLDKYASIDTKSRARRHDLFFDSALGIKQVPPGTYTLVLLFHDKNSDKTLTTKQVFKVVADTP